MSKYTDEDFMQLYDSFQTLMKYHKETSEKLAKIKCLVDAPVGDAYHILDEIERILNG